MIAFKPHPEIALSEGHFDPAVHKAIYKHNYEAILADIANGHLNGTAVYKDLILNDLFFICYFVMENPLYNCPFGVNACHMVEENNGKYDVEVWARGHLKSFSMTQAQRVQRIVTNPETCALVLSYKKPASDKFVFSVMQTLSKPIMYQCFPDILYEKPSTQSSSWSVQGGLIVKRQSTSRKEKTLEGAGLLEGMPTGGHWDDLDYDDVETLDTASSPDVTQDLINAYEMSQNLAMPDGSSRRRVIGTFYSHTGLLSYLISKKDIHGNPMHNVRIIPATHDGTKNGYPIFLSQKELDRLKTDQYSFNTQQLCNPTPKSEVKIDYNYLRAVEPKDLPHNRIKFIIIDPAGDDAVTKGNRNDNWAMGCISVKPTMDDFGLSDIYIEDVIYGKMTLDAAIDNGIAIHIRNGRILGTGIERVGTDSTYKHIMDGLKKRRRCEIKHSERDAGNIVLLSPDGKKKEYRIETALAWPWNNGKIHYVTTIPQETLHELRVECDKFPFHHVDILDMISYIYILMEKMKYSFYLDFEEEHDEDDVGTVTMFEGRSAIAGY